MWLQRENWTFHIFPDSEMILSISSKRRSFSSDRSSFCFWSSSICLVCSESFLWDPKERELINWLIYTYIYWLCMQKLSVYLFMKDKFSLSDLTSFSRFSHRLVTDCMSDGRVGIEFLSFASCILKPQKECCHQCSGFLWNSRSTISYYELNQHFVTNAQALFI